MGQSPPPAPLAPGPCVALKQLWSLLPEAKRQSVLLILGQAAVRHVRNSRREQEVSHDRR